MNTLSPPVTCSPSDHILCSVTWVTDERVAVQWLSRKQNYVVVQIYDLDGSSWRAEQVALRSTGFHFGHLADPDVWADVRPYEFNHCKRVSTLNRNSSKRARQAGSAT